MDQVDLTRVKIVSDKHVSQFDMNGQVQKFREVSYFVGPYGPFKATFPIGKDSAPEIQASIKKQQADLQALHGSL